jgi:peptide deformylase
MTTFKKQVQLKLKKFDELMIKYKIEHLKDSVFYSKLHKLDEKVQEISKLVDNNKD